MCAVLGTRNRDPQTPRAHTRPPTAQDKLIDPVSVTRVFKITKFIGMLVTGLMRESLLWECCTGWGVAYAHAMVHSAQARSR